MKFINLSGREIIEKEIRNIQLQQGQNFKDVKLPDVVYQAGTVFVRSAPNFSSNGEPVRFKMIHKLPLGSDSIYEALLSSVSDDLSDAKNIEEWQHVCQFLLTYAQNLILGQKRPEFRHIKVKICTLDALMCSSTVCVCTCTCRTY